MKKLSKKQRIIVISAVMAVTIVFVCVYFSGIFEVLSLNRHSSLAVDLLTPKKSVNLDEYEIYPTEGMGNGTFYVHKDGCHRICIGAYPDSVSPSSKVFAISIEGGCADNVFGISVGTSAREIYAIFDKYNYKIQKGSDDWIVAEKGRISIAIRLNEAKNAEDIAIRVMPTNIFGVQY